MRDWLGSGAISTRETAERIVTEALRRFKLLARNDATVVPPPDDETSLLAAESFAIQPFGSDATPLNVPGSKVRRDTTGGFMAGEIEAHFKVKGGTAADATITQNAGEGLVIRLKAGSAYDFVLYGPGGVPIVTINTGTQDLVLQGKLQVMSRFGCNGAVPQPSVASTAPATTPTVGGTGFLNAPEMVAFVNHVNAIYNTLKNNGQMT